MQQNKFKNNKGNEKILYAGPAEKNDFLYIDLAGITYPCAKYHLFHNPIFEVTVIEYIQKGSGILEYEGKQYPLQEGDSYLIQSNTKCFYYADPQNPFQKIWINVNGRLLDHLLDAYQIDMPFLITHVSLDKPIRTIHELLTQYKHNAVNMTEVNLLLHEIVALLGNNLIQESKEKTLSQQIKTYLDYHVDQPLSIGELAEQFYISRSYLMAIFKKEYGQPPYSYFLEQKVKAACALLKKTSLSVKEIAEKLSFSDASYFSNTFKLYKGVSPKQYRNAHNE